MTTTIDWKEELPRVRTVVVRKTLRRLAFPWVVSIIVRDSDKFNSMYVYSRPSPMLSVDDALFRFPLTYANANCEINGNISADGKVCMGDSMAREPDPRAAFWNSNFRECLTETGILFWEELTRVSPESVATMPFQPANSNTGATFMRLYGPHLHPSSGSTPWDLNGRLDDRRAEGRAIVRDIMKGIKT